MTPSTLLFDYGGTLDSGARHWNFVLLDGYRYAAGRFPALRAVDGEVWRDAYVHGERTLARPSSRPTTISARFYTKKSPSNSPFSAKMAR